jgi:sialate O-acetylesterase
MVHLDKLRTAGPSDLTIVALKGSTDRNAITLKNVLVGEVWIASGQSNMEWPLRASLASETAIAQSASPMIRLYTVPKQRRTSHWTT